MSDSFEPYEISLFVLQKIFSVFSAIGSLMIISQVSRSKFNRSKPQQRLILCISICDFLASIVWTFTNLFMPTGTMLFAVGNEASCEAQGFFVQLFLPAGFIYMCALQLQYLLVIKYGWNAKKVCKIEHYLHAFPICFGLGTATAATALNLMNPANWDCWIAPYPADCTATYVIKQGGSDLTETDCIRGDNAELYRWAFFFGPLWMAIVFCLYIMFRVFRTMRQTEAKSRRWMFRGTSIRGSRALGRVPRSVSRFLGRGPRRAPHPSSMSDEIRKQSLFYTASFFSVWTFPTIARLIQVAGGTVHPILVVLSGSFICSQGIWNAFIYFRPRYLKCDEKGFCRKVWILVRATLFPCLTARDYTKDNKDYVDKNDYIGTNSSTMIRASSGHRVRSTASDVSSSRRQSDPPMWRPGEDRNNDDERGANEMPPVFRPGSSRAVDVGADNVVESEEKVDCDTEANMDSEEKVYEDQSAVKYDLNNSHQVSSDGENTDSRKRLT